VSRETKVYKLVTGEGFEWLMPVEERDFDRLRFDGHSRAGDWKPVQMRRLMVSGEGRKLKPCDFPACSSDLILSGRAKEEIGNQLQKYGELLPLACADGEFWTLNVTTLIDALDEGASQLVRATDGGRVLMIRRHVFKGPALEGAGLFKLPQIPAGSIYATDLFAERLKEHKLIGLAPTQVWAPN
jgi:hypothetical protein